MPLITIVLGLLLIALGVVGRILSHNPGITVWIPAFAGTVFVVLGLVARYPGARRHAMHGAALLALLAIGGAGRGLLQLPALLSGGEVQRPLAVAAQSIMAGLCAVFLVLAIRSFVAARLARRAQATA